LINPPKPNPKLPEDGRPRTDRMNVLCTSSGNVATFAQKAGQRPLWSRYCSTFERY
jgi:hypothetical protein